MSSGWVRAHVVIAPIATKPSQHLPRGFFARPAEVVARELLTYPEGDARRLHQALLLLKRSRCLNISAFCREAIAEKLERLEAAK
jgi:hypothetical protein